MSHTKIAIVAFITFLSGLTNTTESLRDIQGTVPFELKDIVDNLKNTQKLPDTNLPKGIMLVGRPGTGKTNLFRKMAKELPANSYVYISAINLKNAEMVDKLFDIALRKAKQNYHGKCIIMIDDFDSFDISENNILNQKNTPENVVALMNQLSGFEKNERLIVIAASNKTDIHPDLGRSLRIDEVIELSLPDLPLRLKMLRKFNEGQKPFADNVQLNQIASLSYDFTPADLLKLIQKANLYARQASRISVSQQELIDALKGILIAKGRFDKDIMIRIKALTNLLNGKKEPCGFDRLIGTIPQEARQLVEQLNGSNKFDRFKLKPSKGILFTGPPGTGKTTLARAIAEEAKCGFVAISGAEFSQSLVGGGAQIVKDLFKKAREKAENSPSGRAIIFIDEVDSIGQRSGDILDSTITQLLTEMDGFAEGNAITVIGATNHPENIDLALTRPGRFDKIVEIGLPDELTRKKLLEYYIKGRPYNIATIDLQKVAEFADCCTPADLKEMINKAALLAVDANARQIERSHILEAIKQGLHEKMLKGDHNARQLFDRLDVVFNGKTSKKGFKQIVGGVPEEIQDLIELLKEDSSKFKNFGIPCPKGFLLTGPPGTGKTLLAKAIAEELDCGFISKNGSDFIEQFVGMGAKRVREVFEEARKKAKGNRFGKAIIFVDELDAIGSRSGNPMQSEEVSRTVTALLNEMDGIAKDDSVIVIGATNNPNRLDPALKRPGRLDTMIEIGLPDLAKRIEFLKFYTKPCLITNIHFDNIARQLNGYSPADIKEMVNNAARIALRKRYNSITQECFELAIEKTKASKKTQLQAYI